MHLSVNQDIMNKLRVFARNRKKSMTAVVESSLELLFKAIDTDPLKEEIIIGAIKRRFLTTAGIPDKYFYIFLYLLAQKCPQESSKTFWEPFYLSSFEKTHTEVFLETKEEIDQEIKRVITNGHIKE